MVNASTSSQPRVAALAGAGTVSLGHVFGLPAEPVALFGAALCLFLRLMSLYRGWRLPVGKPG